jgi:hypothetical protein
MALPNVVVPHSGGSPAGAAEGAASIWSSNVVVPHSGGSPAGAAEGAASIWSSNGSGSPC